MRSVAGAKCLVQVKRGRAPIRLMNPTSKDIYIPGHRVVATVSDGDTDNIHDLNVSKQTYTQANVNAASQDSASENSDIKFNVSSANLSDSERSELLQFLERNRDVF